VDVLIDGESKKNPDVLAGYTSKSKLVNVKAPKSAIGKIIPVKIIETKSWSMDGEAVEIEKMAEVN
jgi:tRNA-2-methylthio-N6-dimethylallyladenosine synthase